jgi:hypothetical protein
MPLFRHSLCSVFTSFYDNKWQTRAIPRIDSGISFVNNTINSLLPIAEPFVSVNPLQIWVAIGTWVWFAVATVLLIYGIVSFIVL